MSIYSIVFSLTGGTKKAADLFASSFCPESAGIDLADRSRDFSVFSFHTEDICIISVPSYRGRVPAVAVPRLRCMKGNGAKAILIVVYGNRAYDDTFAELRDVLTDAGFSCMRCIAVCPQNARSVSKVLLAAGSMKLRKICREYKKNELFLP